MPFPYTLEDARGWIALAQIEREHESALHLLAVRTADERIAGAAALRLHEVPERHGEAGYWVAADARRTGVATGALSLLTGLAFGPLSLPYVDLVISPDNEASLALARRAGFAPRDTQLREFKGEMLEFEIWRKAA